jgi:hypothetical protein
VIGAQFAAIWHEMKEIVSKISENNDTSVVSSEVIIPSLGWNTSIQNQSQDANTTNNI